MTVRRRILLAALTVGVVGTVAGWLVLSALSGGPAPSPSVSVGVLGYTITSEKRDFVVRVGVTNIGRVPLHYAAAFTSKPGQLRVEVPGGWRSLDVGLVAPMVPTAPLILMPGSNTAALVFLPREVIRWQVGFDTQAVSVRDCVLSRIPSRWRPRLSGICSKFLSGKPGPVKQIWSDVFQVTKSPEPLDSRPINNFGRPRPDSELKL